MRRQRNTETDIHSAAEDGLRGSRGSLPFASQIQQSFGRHDVSSVAAHVDGAAKKANSSMGSLAYATGNSIAFGQSPDLHTAAHEAAHIVQQRAGVHLSGGVGQSGDRYERHADAVAARVVQGRSAEDLLDEYAPTSSGSSGVQHRVVQMWSEQEHRAVGNDAASQVAPNGGADVGVQGGRISYGGAAQHGGDYAANPEELNSRGAGLEARARQANYVPTNTVGGAAMPRTTDCGTLSTTDAVIGLLTSGASVAGTCAQGHGARTEDFVRMVSIATTNVNHFYPLMQAEYRNHHARACELAREARTNPARFDEAIREEGFAAHFLMDSFAAGHQTPRALDRIHAQDHRQSVAAVATAAPLVAAPGVAAAATYAARNTEAGLGHLRSKPFHDALNRLPAGIPLRGVANNWHGDDTMTGTERAFMALQVARSLAEIFRLAGRATTVTGSPEIPQGPDGAAIMASSDEVAKRIWGELQSTYGGNLESAERRDSDATITSAGGTSTNVRGMARDMREAVYGGQQGPLNRGQSHIPVTDGTADPRLRSGPAAGQEATNTSQSIIEYTRQQENGSNNARSRPLPLPARPSPVHPAFEDPQ
jgi:hypothetical protein